jgi:DNA invertase Pin-like site-specific DNA recombinase
MLIGYARVSTQDQNLNLQVEALTKAGCKKVFEDKISGSRAERPGLTKAQETLREGDTLVVWKLDRLGRSVKNLVDLVGELHKQRIQFKSLTDAIDTGTASGRFFFHVMASLAEMERELTIERTRAGLEVARQLGRKGGRKRQMTDSKIKSAKKLLANGGAPSGRRQQPRRVRADPLPVDSSLNTSLACLNVRFLREPHLKRGVGVIDLAKVAGNRRECWLTKTHAGRGA